ncbi:MAG: zf-HC2 domain-containing protein [Rhizomicrobium sp.]|nr:zf-HC2 domain-containing protein [Rhizomicrobium sp.]
MSCSRQLEVQAWLDDEMDAVSGAALERHIAGCEDCARLRSDIEALRAALHQAPYHRASQSLRRGLTNALARESGGRRPLGFWTGAATGMGATAMAACLALFLLLPSAQDEIAHDVVTAHLRSLAGNHLVDVVSSDHHTVKPWFDGRADLAPATADFDKQGFKLVGGRVDYVHGSRTAVLVYRHGAHVVNVFAWKNDGAARAGLRQKNGYTLLSWASGDLFYCAISDTATQDLQSLAHLIKQS